MSNKLPKEVFTTGISSNIKRLRQERGWTQEQLAEKVDVTRSTVTQWETGWSQPRMGAVERLAAAFEITVPELVSDEISLTSDGYTDVPLLGSIAAGEPIDMENVESTFPVPSHFTRLYSGCFLLKVQGESMNRKLPNGSYALVNPTSEAVDGSACAVCVNGYAATIKRVHLLANGIELLPDSTDPTIKGRVFDYGEEGTETVTVIGEVVWYTVPFDFEI